jgi:hypothetical protein
LRPVVPWRLVVAFTADARLDLLAVAGCAARPAWMDRAECRSYPAEWWFEVKSTRRRAIRVCGQCPVRAECLAHALDNGELGGVWGGTTAGKRQRLRDRVS